MAKRFSRRNLFHRLTMETDGASTEDDGYLPDLVVGDSQNSLSDIMRSSSNQAAISGQASHINIVQQKVAVLGKRSLSSLSTSQDVCLSTNDAKPKKQRRTVSVHKQTTSMDVSDTRNNNTPNNQRDKVSVQRKTSEVVSLSTNYANAAKTGTAVRHKQRRAQLRAQLRAIPQNAEIIDLDSDSDQTIIYSKSQDNEDEVMSHVTSKPRTRKNFTRQSTTSKALELQVPPMDNGSYHSTMNYATFTKYNNTGEAFKKTHGNSLPSKPSTSYKQATSQCIKVSSTCKGQPNSSTNYSASKGKGETNRTCGITSSSVIELSDSEDDVVPLDSNNPIIYEKGQPARINPNLNTANLQPRFKRLLKQKTPVLKKVQELTDVSQFHYVILDAHGNVSKDNDSVAQFVIDLGIIVKNAGKKLMQDGMKLQHDIAHMREIQEKEIKQEIHRDNGSQDLTNHAVDTTVKPKPVKPLSRRSRNSLSQNKVTEKNVKSVSKTNLHHQERSTRPKTAEECLKHLHICQQCGESFTNAENLNTHLNRHSNNIIVCTDCYKTFYSVERHRKHKQAHLFGYQTCDRCHVTFDTIKALRAHVKRYENEKYVCTIPKCKRGFKDKSNLVVHMQYGHLNERTVPCDVCHKFYRTPNVVRSHKHRDHKDKKAVVGLKHSLRK